MAIICRRTDANSTGSQSTKSTIKQANQKGCVR